MINQTAQKLNSVSHQIKLTNKNKAGINVLNLYD